ncbi:MAG: MBOAT family protein [Nevskia sp.]
MLFNSTVFLFTFLPVAITGYYGLARWHSVNAARVWLCLSSFVFYGWWNPLFLLLLTGSIGFNYLLSLGLGGHDAPTPRQRLLITGGVVCNLLLLVYFKYLFPLLGWFHSIGWSGVDYGSIVLPIGISFFTFTQLGYLIDCHQGIVKDRSFLSYVLFVTFFPHLIAGPILHHREIMPQFADEASYKLRYENIAAGLTVFALGMVKKVLLADAIAPWAEGGFDHPADLGAIQSWSVALAYSMQLYFDFSGYSDMAVGLGILFGIRMPLNFNSPYQSTSIIDFWQRWHMTLTRYLTLLLYNPVSLMIARRRKQAGLAVNQKAAKTPAGFASMIALPTMTTMALAGIWHGAGLQFLIFGLLHGSYLTINHAWRVFSHTADTKAHAVKSRGALLWRWALTYLAVLVGQIFFRANDAGDALHLLAGAVGLHGSGLPLTVPLNSLAELGRFKDFLIGNDILKVGLRAVYNEATWPLFTNIGLIVALGAIAFGAPNVYQLLGASSPALTKVKPLPWPVLAWRPSWVWAVGLGALLYWTAQAFDNSGRFLYFQF